MLNTSYDFFIERISVYNISVDRLIRQVGHKLKEIGALTHPLRAEKDRDVIEAAHTLTRVEEVLEDCFSALENYTGS